MRGLLSKAADGGKVTRLQLQRGIETLPRTRRILAGEMGPAREHVPERIRRPFPHQVPGRSERPAGLLTTRMQRDQEQVGTAFRVQRGCSLQLADSALEITSGKRDPGELQTRRRFAAGNRFGTFEQFTGAPDVTARQASLSGEQQQFRVIVPGILNERSQHAHRVERAA